MSWNENLPMSPEIFPCPSFLMILLTCSWNLIVSSIFKSHVLGIAYFALIAFLPAFWLYYLLWKPLDQIQPGKHLLKIWIVDHAGSKVLQQSSLGCEANFQSSKQPCSLAFGARESVLWLSISWAKTFHWHLLAFIGKVFTCRALLRND